MAENTGVNILECLMNNIEKRIDIYVEESDKIEWGKSLKNMLLFTIKEIELHRKSSCKLPGLAIVKTLDHGKEFREERYISVSLDPITGFVTAAKCYCLAGNSGYCNHIMALLFELADYSLNQLDCVPEEISCKSKNRQWGIPSEAQTFKDPLIKSSIRSDNDKKYFSSTLYDPRRCETNIQKISDFQTKLMQKDKRILLML